MLQASERGVAPMRRSARMGRTPWRYIQLW
jgi:hypothetical protein